MSIYKACDIRGIYGFIGLIPGLEQFIKNYV